MKTIVVTGATGNIGSRVFHELAARKRDSVIGFVRDPVKAAPLTAAGTTLRYGRFEDPASIRAGFADADTVVLITGGTGGGAHSAEQAEAAIDAARAAGVVREGDRVVITAGTNVNVAGSTNVIKVDVA